MRVYWIFTNVVVIAAAWIALLWPLLKFWLTP